MQSYSLTACFSKPYDVWAVIEKDSKEKPGGTIKHCYCTCTAGLYSACNHVAGLLFIVGSAVLTGVTKPSCIDRLAKWTVPPARSELNSGPVFKIVFKKDHHRLFATVDHEKQQNNVKGPISFSPMSDEQEVYLKDQTKMRQDLMNIIHAPKSCFMELLEAKKLNVKPSIACTSSIVVQISLWTNQYQ